MLLYETYISSNKAAFLTKVNQIAANLKVDPNWLMAIMYSESRLDHTIVNPVSKSVGLIQFMPSTALSLGTSVEKLKAMTNVQQLDYVNKFFSPVAGKIKNFLDLYLYAFFPIAVGKPDSFVIEAQNLSAAIVTAQNKQLDLNNDGKITVGEFKQYVTNKFPDIVKLVDSIGLRIAKTLLAITAINMLLVAGYLGYRKFIKKDL